MAAILQHAGRAGFCWRHIILVVAVALNGCAGLGASDDRDSRYVYQSDENYVRLEPIEPGAPANAHPFTVSAEQLRRLLARPKVRGASSIGTTPVFSQEELESIASPLASALSKAGPNQDVTFAVASHRGLFGKLSPKSVTTGRMFVRGDSLNLIFGLMQARLDTGRLDYTGADPAVTAGLRARRIGDTIWKIEPGPGRFHEQRGDWLVFDRSAIPAMATPTTPRAHDTGARPAEAAPTTDGKAQEIENRLRVLDALREKGAITEQEYRDRRRAILDQL